MKVEKMSSEKPKVNLPWIEKYRPGKLDDLVAHEDIINTIGRFIKEGRLPHLLFYGPPGTGKTSTILACAREMYTPKELQSMVLELNASDDRGIGIVREQILSFASTRTIFKSGFKLIILDEADAMTHDAQNALRRADDLNQSEKKKSPQAVSVVRTAGILHPQEYAAKLAVKVIEKFTENVRFCLICNYLSKIIPALQSRCTRFRFGPLSTAQMTPRMEHVIQEEGLNVTEDGKKAIVELSQGDMRKTLNLLQSTAMAFGEVNEVNVYTCIGHPLKSDISDIMNWLLNEDFTSAYNKIMELKTLKGLALQDILSQVHLFVHRIEFPPAVKMEILDKMAALEFRLCVGPSEKVQLSSLIALFQLARNKVIE